MSKVQTISLHDPAVDFPRKTTTYEPHSNKIATVFAVNKVECFVDSYTSEEFIKALNAGEFDPDFRVAFNGSDFTFFEDKANALAFLQECHDKLLA